MKNFIEGLKFGAGIFVFVILSFFIIKAGFDSNYIASGSNTVLTQTAWNKIVNNQIKYKVISNITTNTNETFVNHGLDATKFINVNCYVKNKGDNRYFLLSYDGANIHTSYDQTRIRMKHASTNYQGQKYKCVIMYNDNVNVEY